MAMNPVVKAKWVAALRSGEYKQGKDRLCSSDGAMCCLGVLCDLHAQENGEKWEQVATSKYYLGERNYIAPMVQEWAGLTQRTGAEVKVGEFPELLPVLNDHGASFAQIADAIEAQL